MAREIVATQKIVGAGLAVNLTAPTAEGDVIDNGAVALMVVNGSGAPINVTVQTPAKQSGLDVEERIVAVAAGATELIGPFPKSTYGRTSAPDVGQVYVDYSAQLSVTRAAVGF
ncbi:hypothetical protein [Kribbella italica]|uniref:Uncharacterized protein n=1 Tax=Kribbella italica TaxID=1540520 RepID=A0A7W9MW04_9ACTN|nr:hypothetical protein [Kribbella italica]MBB5837750.1 hypothetical protein [Kribbella italica]